MNKRITTVCLVLCMVWLNSFASVETLADVDADIRNGDTTPTRISGQAAYNVYTDVTGNPNNLLERKITILNSAGISNFASSGRYSNFYSFTGKVGVTDTKIDIVTTNSTIRLYRRGTSSRKETESYLGSWWSGSYLGTEATRNGQAVLGAWGSDLKRIYVIDVPAGNNLVGGLAAPMEQGGEYRAGGAYQYYYRGVPSNWLVYALYAPDYLKSYASAITGAQKLGQVSLEDISNHLSDLRYSILENSMANAIVKGPEKLATKSISYQGNQLMDLTDWGRSYADESLSNIWFRFYGGYSRIADDGYEAGQKSQGMHMGWEKLVRGGAPDERNRWHIGALLGQGNMKQNDVASDVKNDIRHSYVGIYSLYQPNAGLSSSWYSSTTLLYGHLTLANQVPGESGYGLKQDYAGNLLSASLENGVTFRCWDGWIVEPQIQFLYTKALQGNFVDNIGTTVTVRRSGSLIGNLGIKVLRNQEIKPDQHSEVWARVSYQREFCGKNIIDVAGDQEVSGGGRNVFKLNIGGKLDISRKFNVGADVSKMFGDEHGYRCSLSLKNFW